MMGGLEGARKEGGYSVDYSLCACFCIPLFILLYYTFRNRCGSRR